MPGLILYGQRWLIGSDDFTLPALGLDGVRALWFICLLTYTVYVTEDLASCDDGGGGALCVLYLLLALDALGFALALALAGVSARGPMLDVKARAAVPGLLYALSAVHVAEAAVTAVGAWLAWGADDVVLCPDDLKGAPDHRLLFQIAITMAMIVLGAIGVAVVLFFDRRGSELIRTSSREVLRPSEAALELPLFRKDAKAEEAAWERRCRCLFSCAARSTCFCISGNAGGDARAAAGDSPSFQIMAKMLHQLMGNIDVVVTDVVAGSTLYRARQRGAYRERLVAHLEAQAAEGADVAAELDYLRGPGASSKAAKRSIRHSHRYQGAGDYREVSLPRDAAVLRDAGYFVKYAIGAYGWALELYTNVVNGDLCGVPATVTGSCCTRRGAMGDNCFGTNFASYLRVTGLKREDVAYASFANVDNHIIPFVVAKDHAARAVVVACRGSLSAEDILIDVTATSAPVAALRGEFELPPAVTSASMAHSGILTVAATIARELQGQGVLSALLGAGGACEGYELVVTGHSLGAGAAATLGLLLKAAFPPLRAICFSPPGGLVDEALAESMDDYCTSVVVGEDLIPRLSVPAVFRLRDGVIECLTHAKANKAHIYGTAFQPYPAVEELMYDPNEEGFEAAEATARLFFEEVNMIDAARTLGVEGDSFMPGRVLHYAVVEVERERCALPGCDKHRVYKPFWATRRDFQDIVMSHRMMLDHMPDYCAKVVTEYAASLDAGYQESVGSDTELTRGAQGV